MLFPFAINLLASFVRLTVFSLVRENKGIESETIVSSPISKFAAFLKFIKMELIEIFNYYYHHLADPRIKGWFLMGSVWPTVLILFSYLYFVFQCGPRYMKNRPAYKLTAFIRIYNIFQILANIVIIREFLLAYPDGMAFKCAEIKFSTDASALRALNACYYSAILKIVDLIETGVFVLRKKKSQITILHLYHHLSTVLIALIFIRYVASGMALFFPALNCAVHVIMYSYYFLSNIKGPIKQMVLPLKRYITIVQMVQFLMMGVQICIAMLPSCPAPKIPTYLMLLNVIFNFGLFYNFYKINYSEPKNKNV